MASPVPPCLAITDLADEVGNVASPIGVRLRFSGRDPVRKTEQVGTDVYPCTCNGSDILHEARERTVILLTAEKTYNKWDDVGAAVPL